ncbi:uncharacterized protein LOC117180265 [Belonocnema kinseyi]|uniref:uncharacterized protein LOC117180265 n=1 Tax=Belonocnema kinseyi TaxID=2817044 RepID=UPI00143D17F3|nr:uncharacterized protein LOC117180265 [Belonocnema kinseyi]
MDELEKLLNDLASTSMNDSAPQITGLSYRSMPKIELPKFSGSYTEWENFKDLFTSLVHSNPGVSSVEKLYHLKSSLIGEAAQLLHRIPITQGNYQRCRDLLSERFENKRVLINSHLAELFSIQPMKAESSSALKEVYNATIYNAEALSALEEPVDKWSSWLVYQQSSKSQFQKKRFGKFTKSSSATTANVNAISEQPMKEQAAKEQLTKKPQERKCFFCREPHYLMSGPQFERSHLFQNCASKNLCQICQAKHQTVLHDPSSSTGQSSSMISNTSLTPHQAQSTHAVSVMQISQKKSPLVLLTTAMGNVTTLSGHTKCVRVLIDQGSEVSIIFESFAQSLQLPRTRGPVVLLGVGESKSGKSRGSVNVVVSPSFDSGFKLQLRALVLPKLISKRPEHQISLEEWPHLTGLQLADPKLSGPPGTPVAQNSVFGWILCGPTGNTSPLDSSTVNMFHCSKSEELFFDLQKVWEDSEVVPPKPFRTAEKETCEKLFQKTHSRTKDGRYVVHQLIKSDVTSLGYSYSAAPRMLLHMEQRFKRDVHLQEAYAKFMEEYQLQHMKSINIPADPRSISRSFFLPHHGVWREFSSTTKLRIIVHQDDQDLQLILWRESQNEPVQVFRLSTLTYGLTCAPFLALRTVQQLGLDEGDRFPLTAEVIKNGLYVDDVLSGPDNLEVPIELHNQLRGLFMVDLRPIKEGITKRLVVNQSAQLFDPLGWLTPVIIVAKIFMQELWKLNLSWDDPLPEGARHRWIKYYEDLPRLSAVRIPSWIGFSSRMCSFELHGFADASEKAYGAVVYLKTISSNGNCFIGLISSKTKVAPVQTVPLPRLELCTSVLLARLVAHLRTQLRFDAALHLCWMTYVANRVSEIQTIVPSAFWHHVPGADNPAECAFRGLSACELSQFSLWWNGPPGLKRQEEWPLSLLGPPENTVAKEERRVTVNVAVRVNETCIRSSNSSLFWIQQEQNRYFSNEITALKNKMQISKTSTLIKLTPFFDGQLLRVGGRLKHSLLTYDEKHPLILPPESILTTFIIRDCHLRCLHGDVQLTLGTLRQSYWILRGRNLQQLMSDLSSIRVTPPERAFMNTGVDYAGPINVRTSKGRGHHSHKAWICIFVCCASRSVHLELVSDYTAEAFIVAYIRFTSRRGLCRTFSSDEGTNFVGADRQLQEMFSEASAEFASVATYLASHGTEWKFNPHAAPHFGGLWEAAVKSTKFHPRRVIVYSTLTAQSDDTTDISALTPGHFLIGGPLNAVPEPSLADVLPNRLTRWQLIQQMRDHFWMRWSAEYLKELQPRSKWTTSSPFIQIGDLDLIRHENLPPTQWPMGRVRQLHPGKDGLVRVVTLKIKTSYTRSANRSIVPSPTFILSAVIIWDHRFEYLLIHSPCESHALEFVKREERILDRLLRVGAECELQDVARMQCQTLHD